MLSIAYSISPVMTKYLGQIEKLRRDIVLSPLSPEKELSLQFQATMSRIVYAFAAIGQELPFDEVQKALTLTQVQGKGRNKQYAALQNYKKALDFIKRNWLVSDQTIDPETLIKLHSFISRGKLRIAKKQLQEVLDYLQIVGETKIPAASGTSASNPFLQAAIAKLLLKNLEPFTEGNDRFSTLAGYLFIYKAGLDCRGFLILEQLGQAADKYLEQYTGNRGKSIITGWLEYYTKAVYLQLEYAYTQVAKTTPSGHESAYDKLAELNERQKEILNLLDNPNTIITNRTIQKLFKISQITASRDLARLTALGLLFAHGKGRSVRYTRV